LSGFTAVSHEKHYSNKKIHYFINPATGLRGEGIWSGCAYI